jgi:hypothetical protein
VTDERKLHSHQKMATLVILIATVKIQQDLQAPNGIVRTKKRSTTTQQIWKGKI